MNGHTENKKNTYAHLDRLSTEALEELLCADIKSPDDDDDEVVLHILEVIEQREKAIPTGRLSDVDKALEEFQTYYNIPEMNGVTLYPEETAESVTDAVTMVGFIPKRPWIRVLGTIAATVIFMFAMLIGAQAAGIDVFGAIGRWTDETFHFVSFPHSIPQDQETTAPNLENLLLNRGETLNRKCRRSNRARCAQSSIENSFRRRGRGRATPSSSSRRDSLIARRYPQWRRFTLTGVSIWPITYYLTLSNCVEEMPKAALSKAVLHGQRVGLVCIMNTPFSITISY